MVGAAAVVAELLWWIPHRSPGLRLRRRLHHLRQLPLASGAADATPASAASSASPVPSISPASDATAATSITAITTSSATTAGAGGTHPAASNRRDARYSPGLHRSGRQAVVVG